MRDKLGTSLLFDFGDEVSEGFTESYIRGQTVRDGSFRDDVNSLCLILF